MQSILETVGGPSGHKRKHTVKLSPFPYLKTKERNNVKENKIGLWMANNYTGYFSYDQTQKILNAF